MRECASEADSGRHGESGRVAPQTRPPTSPPTHLQHIAGLCSAHIDGSGEDVHAVSHAALPTHCHVHAICDSSSRGGQW